MPQIEVTFDIDANGILNVTAKDKGTGKEQTIKIESSGGLTKDEIERMQRDAEAHAAEDKQKRELAEARNTAEQRVYQLEKLLEENKDKLSDADKSAVRAAIDKVNEAKKGDDAGRDQRGRSTTSSGPARRWPSTSTPPRPRPAGADRHRRAGTRPATRAERRQGRRRHRRRVRGEEMTRRGRPDVPDHAR